MTTDTFVADTTTQNVAWSSPAIWSDGVVPNSPTADVAIPAILQVVTDTPYSYFITIGISQSFQVRSLNMTGNYLELIGNLTVDSGLMLSPDGYFEMEGGTLTVDSLQNYGSDFGGDGTFDVAGSAINQGAIGGTGLAASFGSLDNFGTLSATGYTGLTITTPQGGFANLANSTLTGGTYEAIAGGTLFLNVGEQIVTDSATIILGSYYAAADSPNTIKSYDAETNAYVSLQATLQTVSPSGILSIIGAPGFSDANALTVQGTLEIADAATFATGGLDITPTGQAQISGGTLSGPIQNDGLIIAGITSDVHDYPDSYTAMTVIGSSVTGSGSFQIAAGSVFVEPFPNGSATFTNTATLELTGADAENVTFDNNLGLLVLDQPQSFQGTIGVVGAGDGIELTGVSLASVTGYDYAGNSTGGTLTLQDSGGSISLGFAGDFTTSSFLLAAGPQPFSSSPPTLMINATPAPAPTQIGQDANDTAVIGPGEGNLVLAGPNSTIDVENAGYAAAQISGTITGLTIAITGTTLQAASVDQVSFIDGMVTFDSTSDAAQIARLYQAALGRTPDPTGMAGWVAAMNQGTPLTTIAGDFLGSAEFAARFPGASADPTSFVTQLYANVLNRAPDVTGLSNWTNALDSGALSQAQVVVGFSESAENQNNTAGLVAQGLWVPSEAADEVARLYYAALDRAPDFPGLSGWTDGLTSGSLSLPQVVAGFTNSPEFQADYGTLNNQQFVDLLYQNVLGRAPDPTGEAGWTTALNDGALARSGVVLGFSESAENVARLAPVIQNSGITFV